MDSENLITWNVPNFITVCLMLAVLWVMVGFAGHMIWTRKGKPQGVTKVSGADGAGQPVGVQNEGGAASVAEGAY